MAAAKLSFRRRIGLKNMKPTARRRRGGGGAAAVEGAKAGAVQDGHFFSNRKGILFLKGFSVIIH